MLHHFSSIYRLLNFQYDIGMIIFNLEVLLSDRSINKDHTTFLVTDFRHENVHTRHLYSCLTYKVCTK